MLVSQSVVLDVPLVEENVAEIPDNTPYPRAMYFHNLHSSPIEIKVQTSTDGGSTWVDVVTPTTLAPDEVLSAWVSNPGPQIRVRGAGGGPVYFGLARFVKPTTGLTTGIRLPMIV